jgi:hypothetical protein
VAAVFEVIEVVVITTGNGELVHGKRRQVAICKTAAQAQTDYVNRGIAAYQEAVANPTAPLKAYVVRPYEIDLVGLA